MAARATTATATFPARARQRLETRDRVFEAALGEFRRRGVAAAQIEDVVRAADVARGTFYLHFPTKDHVLLELLRRKQERLAASLESSRSATLTEFLHRAVDLMIEDAKREDPAIWRELSAVIVRHATAMRSEATAMVDVVTRFFGDAQTRGEVREDLSPLELTAVFLPGVYGLLQMKLAASPTELRRALYPVVDVFLRGTAPQKRTWEESRCPSNS